MKTNLGYTLLELLLVISITSLLSLIGFVNYKNFSSDQIVLKAVADIQNILRLTQSNATSQTFCADNVNTGPWKAVINESNIIITCGPQNITQKTLTLENSEVSSIKGLSCPSDSGLPFSVIYQRGVGSLTFSDTPPSSDLCLDSNSWTITITNSKDTSKTKIFTISKGGAIDVP